jgi:hypothetical protein
MGPYYITPLNYRHPLIERRVASDHQLNRDANVNLGYHIHERKYQADHQRFASNVVKAVDSGLPPDASYALSKRHITLVSDREFDCKHLFKSKNPEVEENRHLRNAPCWNHLGDNVKAKLKDLKCTEKEARQAVRDFKYLLKSDSEEQYLERKEELFNTDDDNDAGSPWKKEAAQAYFEKNLDSVCRNEACSYNLAEAGIPDPEMGITNNAIESHNMVLKRQTQNQELPISDNMMNLYFLSRIQAAEINEAYYQQGPYQVKEAYKDLEKDPNDAPSQNIQTVTEMKQYLHEALRDDTNDTPITNVPKKRVQRQHPSTAKMAEMMYQNGNVQLMADDRRILVKSLDGKQKFAINLPLRDCECQVKNCAHLRAALYKLNYTDDFNTPPKLKQRRTAKPKFRRAKGIKSGRKQPRKKDTTAAKHKRKNAVDAFLPMRNQGIVK